MSLESRRNAVRVEVPTASENTLGNSRPKQRQNPDPDLA